MVQPGFFGWQGPSILSDAVLAVGPGTGELDAAFLAVRRQRLVEKRPVVVGIDTGIATGSCCGMASTPWTTTDCCNSRSGTASVYSEHTSVATRLWMKDPASRPPQCATKSTSRKPGNGSPQSENVRTGTPALSFLFPRRLRREPASLRTGARRRFDGGRAYRQDTAPHLAIELEMPVALHRLDQGRQQRLQALPADAIRRLPQGTLESLSRVVGYGQVAFQAAS